MSAAGLGLLTRSATRVVAKVASGFHLLRIDGYSQTKTVLPGQMISSQTFHIGGHSWRIDYYPNGRNISAKSNAISVYLQLADHTKGLIQAQYKFSLLDHGGNAAYELPAETGSFAGVSKVDAHGSFNSFSNLARMGAFRSPAADGEEPGPGCGHEEFIGREELERRREDLIRDDRIVLRCDVGVTQIDCSCLAQDELSEEEESDEHYEAPPPGYGYGYGYGPPPRRRRRTRTEDGEYVKWCLTQEPGGSRVHRLGRGRWYGHGGPGYY